MTDICIKLPDKWYVFQIYRLFLLSSTSQIQAVDIQAFVAKNPTLGFTLILQLTGTNGNCQFDRLTRTKTVESILASMDAEGIEKYIDYLLGQVNGESKE